MPVLRTKIAINTWKYFALRPSLYKKIVNIFIWFLSLLGKKNGSLKFLPFASGWTSVREFPLPEGKSFQSLWKDREK